MANIKTAKKRARQNEKRRLINLSRRTSVKTVVKKVLTALEGGEASDKLKGLLQDAEAKIARAKGKGLIHPRAASRKVSRLAKKVAVALKK